MLKKVNKTNQKKKEVSFQLNSFTFEFTDVLALPVFVPHVYIKTVRTYGTVCGTDPNQGKPIKMQVYIHCMYQILART